MSWHGTKTDWTGGDHVSYAEMNRIAENVNYLARDNVCKDDWTQNDFFTATEWDIMTETVDGLCELCHIDDEAPGSISTSAEINHLEELLDLLYVELEKIYRQSRANRYSGDGGICGDLIYVGGI